MQKSNYLTIFISGAILIMIILGYTDNISKNIEENAVSDWIKKEELIASDTAGDINFFLNDLYTDLEQTSNNPIVINGSYDDLYELLRRLHTRFGDHIDDIYRLDKNGVVILRYPYKENRIGANYTEREDVKQFFIKKEPIFSRLIVTHSDHDAFTINMPIYKNGTFDGILRTTIYLSSIKRLFLEDIKFGKTGYAILFDDNNIFWYHPNTSKIGEFMNLSFKSENFSYSTLNSSINVMDTLKDRLKSGRYSVDYGSYIMNNLGAYNEIKIKNLNLGIVISSNQEDAYLNINENINKLWMITFYVAIIIIIMAILINYKMTQVLRIQVNNKTKDLTKLNHHLESVVSIRTKELEEKSKQLEISNENLGEEVKKKTYELEIKLEREEKAARAMVYVLERTKKINQELDLKKQELSKNNELLHFQQEELHSTNEELMEVQHNLLIEKNNVEKKVIERTKELEDEKNKVEILLDSKNEFINQMSHDIRTPMTPILSLLKLTLDETKDPLQKKDLDICLKNAKYLKNLIDDTLNLAKLESGTIEFNFEKVNLKNVIKEVIENNIALMQKYKVDAIINVSNDVFAKADKLRVQELILNIHTNAIKFMPNGGIIEYNAFPDNQEIEIQIKDNGIGMTPEQIENAFKQFYKADVSRHEIGSTGLGLNICQRIVNRHGGKIWATSEGLNKGTIIHFTLKKY